MLLWSLLLSMFLLLLPCVVYVCLVSLCRTRSKRVQKVIIDIALDPAANCTEGVSASDEVAFTCTVMHSSIKTGRFMILNRTLTLVAHIF
jgi:hypothetical protein